MIKFTIKITTKDDLVLTGGEQEAPSEEVFKAVVDSLLNNVGSGNFMLTDEDNDVIIIPQAIISQSIVQVIKTN